MTATTTHCAVADRREGHLNARVPEEGLCGDKIVVVVVLQLFERSDETCIAGPKGPVPATVPATTTTTTTGLAATSALSFPVTPHRHKHAMHDFDDARHGATGAGPRI